jgi:hypothetical protein
MKGEGMETELLTIAGKVGWKNVELPRRAGGRQDESIERKDDLNGAIVLVPYGTSKNELEGQVCARAKTGKTGYGE